jgi:hypothetical protein
VKSRWSRLLVMGAVLGGALLFWRTGMFGLFPVDRTLVWRLPVSYGEVRKLELQVWSQEDLLKVEQRFFEAGLVGEPELKVPLSKGTHRAIATVWLLGASEARGFQKEFDPGSEETVVIEMKKP